jgi:hypothetical protein
MNRQYSPFRAPKARGLPGRSLYVIDIENMVGSCELSSADAEKIRIRVHLTVAPRDSDHTVIAASHYNAPAAYFGWAGTAQRLARSGKDGADTALLDAISDAAWVADHYDRVVLASGDHAFTYAVAALKAEGVQVIVIRPDTGLSNRMRLVAGPDLMLLQSAMPAHVVNLSRTNEEAA